MKEKPKVLIVDDNEAYRKAFRRNLHLHQFEVCEAENQEDALRVIAHEKPEVLVTDLRMRTPQEGLDLIREVKNSYPLIPIIMISAVGTFEEGAIATQLGAVAVISKSRIEQELDYLYETLIQSFRHYQQNLEYLKELEKAKTSSAQQLPELLGQLRELMQKDDVHPYVKSEIFEFLIQLEEPTWLQDAQQRLSTLGEQGKLSLQKIEEELSEYLHDYPQFHGETKSSLCAAEFFFRQQETATSHLDFSRNVGFSYTFAVENEVKQRLRRRLSRFLTSNLTYQLISAFLDPKINHLDVHFHQYLLTALHRHTFEFNVNNIKQTLERIRELNRRYKPDGLKALAILFLCFAREYSFRKLGKEIKVENPLGIRGLKSDEEILELIRLLALLQYYRNPFIHPEISEHEKLVKLRQTTLDCLLKVQKLG